MMIMMVTAGFLLAGGCTKTGVNANQISNKQLLVLNTTANTNLATNTTAANGNAPLLAPMTNTTKPVSAPAPTVVVPIADFFSRVTKKPFGIYITPATSPIRPEKFTGYHTGADAETTPAEATIDVPVYAMAAGTVVFAGHVNGYGGVIIIRHSIGTEHVLSLSGHLRMTSFTIKVGSSVTAGEKITVLGTGYTTETDGERKHLHFGLIKGWTINYKGYVPTQSQLSAWDDPVAWLHLHGAS